MKTRTMNEEMLKILAIDDNPADVKVLRRLLEDGPDRQFEFVHCLNSKYGFNR